jgi:muramoyltetrapeptide carboxypeptidase
VPGGVTTVLEPGDVVRLVSPAGHVNPETVDEGVKLLQDWGLRVELGQHALGRRGLYSGSDDERLFDLIDALLDPEVRGVLCTRGGYGCQRLLDRLPFGELVGRAKVFLGFSDVTALHVPLVQIAGWVTLHGPSLAWDGKRNGDLSRAALRAALLGSSSGLSPWTVRSEPAESTAALTIGNIVEGTVLGGNLALLASGCGTPYGIRTDGSTILLLEEVNEPPYSIDRLLLQLRYAGVLDRVAGLALGQFVGCEGDVEEPGVVDVLRDWVNDLGRPCLGGLPVGHGREQQVVPMGAWARMDPSDGTLTFCR